MRTLVSPVAVHAVRINHEIEHFSFLLKSIHKKQGVLEVHIVISRSMSKFQHLRLSRRTGKVNRIILYIIQDTSRGIAFRIVLRGVHITLRIV